jgi:DNA excision repair protein ERCC-4
MIKSIEIIADHREKNSEIPGILRQQEGVCLKWDRLSCGDYKLENKLIVERKTAQDFIQSIIDGRLFNQCKRLSSQSYTPFILVEGDLFDPEIRHNMSQAAIQGALISVSINWRIPVIFSKDKQNTVEILITCSRQTTTNKPLYRAGYRPKKLESQRLYFLQGIPKVGAELAKRMLEHFGSLDHIMSASESELKKVQGIGREKASHIRQFIHGE